MAEDLDLNYSVEDWAEPGSDSDGAAVMVEPISGDVASDDENDSHVEETKGSKKDKKSKKKDKKDKKDKNKKRKAGNGVPTAPLDEEARELKKLKKKEKFQAMKAKKRLAMKGNDRPSMGELPVPEAVAFFQSLFKEHLLMTDKKLTQFEEDEWKLDETCIAVVPEGVERTDSEIVAVRTACPSIDKLVSGADPSSKGSPPVVLLTQSAISGVNLIRGMRKLRPRTPVAKLFSRHMKLSQQEQTLQGDVRIAVGTPNRVLKLCNVGSLNFSGTALLIIDTRKDEKGRSLFEQKDICRDFFKLYEKYCVQHVVGENASLKICFW